jgi:riboflavin kinase/FMN adenylyltransferase
MRLVRELADVPPAPDGRSLAIGTFDGVHVGHRRVIGRATDWGNERGTRVAVVTFDPHPLEVLRPEDPPQLLTPLAVKADLVAELGVDELVAIPFAEEFSLLEPERFCEEIVARRLDARHVSVGANFRFGHGARGDAKLLESRAEFATAVVPLVELEGEPVSSSRIRDLLEEGNVERARELLGAPFQLEGEVVAGSERGRELGMPTANLRLPRNLIVPGSGVYAGTALGRPAAINIGVRPTFETAGETLVEAYLLDFDDDLYGSALRLVFLERLRDEVRFESADALIEQMQRDVERVRQIVSAAS